MLNFNFPLFMLMLQIQTEYTHWISAEIFEDWGQNLYEIESKIKIVKCLSNIKLIWLTWERILKALLHSEISVIRQNRLVFH